MVLKICSTIDDAVTTFKYVEGGPDRKAPQDFIPVRIFKCSCSMFKWIGFHIFKWLGGPRKTLPEVV